MDDIVSKILKYASFQIDADFTYTHTFQLEIKGMQRNGNEFLSEPEWCGPFDIRLQLIPRKIFWCSASQKLDYYLGYRIFLKAAKAYKEMPWKAQVNTSITLINQDERLSKQKDDTLDYQHNNIVNYEVLILNDRAFDPAQGFYVNKQFKCKITVKILHMPLPTHNRVEKKYSLIIC